MIAPFCAYLETRDSLRHSGSPMRPRKLTALFAAFGLALTTAPSEAQSPTAQKNHAAAAPQAVAKPPGARVIVRRRSFLDPGTETKRLDGHQQDYAFPPGDPTGAGRSTLFQQNYNVNYQLRNPFPNCFDLLGFCR